MSNPRFLGPLIGIETPSRWSDQCLQGDCGLLGRCHIVQSRWNRLHNQKTRKLQRLCRYLAKDLLWKSQYDTIASGQQACCKLIVEVFYPQVCDKFQQVVTKDRKWQVATNVILSFLYVCMVNTIYLLKCPCDEKPLIQFEAHQNNMSRRVLMAFSIFRYLV